ncbi:DUF4111 domain-containing protein [Candidatus Poribacteria bacterium]|nr:DUF4111 domain-containing protein [Candidatus Poribacteria bacterium]
MFSDWGIQWAVLGVLRQFYTFQENQITTKRKAGEYALSCVPTHWHRLIQEAINLRARSKKSLYRLRVIRTIDAVSFLRYIIRSCNAYLGRVDELSANPVVAHISRQSNHPSGEMQHTGISPSSSTRPRREIPNRCER